MLNYHGEYVELSEMPDGNLRIALTESGREYLQDISEDEIQDRIRDGESVSWQDLAKSGVRFDRSHAEIWAELSEDIRCDSDIEFYAECPSIFFGLTSAPIIAAGVQRNEENPDFIEHAEKVWYFPEYQIRSEIETLRRDSEVTFVSES